jgi:hypothetical protein
VLQQQCGGQQTLTSVFHLHVKHHQVKLPCDDRGRWINDILIVKLPCDDRGRWINDIRIQAVKVGECGGSPGSRGCLPPAPQLV